MKQLDFVHVTIVVWHLTQRVVHTGCTTLSCPPCVGHHCLVFWLCLNVFSVNVQHMFILYSFFLLVAVDKKLEASEKVSISRPLLLV